MQLAFGLPRNVVAFCLLPPTKILLNLVLYAAFSLMPGLQEKFSSQAQTYRLQ